MLQSWSFDCRSTELQSDKDGALGGAYVITTCAASRATPHFAKVLQKVQPVIRHLRPTQVHREARNS